MDTPLLAPHTPAFNAYRIVLDNLLDEVEQQWLLTRETPFGGPLHDLRIAVRSSRVIVAQSKKILSSDLAKDGTDGFTWMAHATNSARDLDVMLKDWTDDLHTLGPEELIQLAPLKIELEQQLRSEQTLLQSDHYNTRVGEFLQGWRNSLHAGLTDAPNGNEEIQDVVDNRLNDLRRNVLRAGKSLTPKSRDADVHALRKEAKKLRYYTENFSSILDPEPTNDYLKELRRVQDTLGRFQDLCIQIDLVANALEAVRATSPNGSVKAAENLTNQLLSAKADAKKKTLKRFSKFADYCTSHTWCIGSWSK
jgi:CHAD domain-containing protein